MSARVFARDIVPALLWMVVIFSLSTSAGGASHTNSGLDAFLSRYFPALSHALTWSERDAIHYYVRKAAHLTEYAILGILLARALRWPLRSAKPRALWGVAWLLATLYASTDEFHQVFVPGRTPEVADVMRDAVGALIGVTVMWLRSRKSLNGPSARS